MYMLILYVMLFMQTNIRYCSIDFCIRGWAFISCQSVILKGTTVIV